MEVVHERCCGLDIHKRTVVACLLRPGQGGQPEREVRSFSTMTRGLLELADWLQTAGCTHVAMASTGSFWKPLYNLLVSRHISRLPIKAEPGMLTAMSRKAVAIELTPEEEAALRRCVAMRHGSISAVQRARIVLAARGGRSNDAIAQSVGVNRHSVAVWRQRVVAERLAGLEDTAPPGRA